jgi:hypothetical protein
VIILRNLIYFLKIWESFSKIIDFETKTSKKFALKKKGCIVVVVVVVVECQQIVFLHQSWNKLK